MRPVGVAQPGARRPWGPRRSGSPSTPTQQPELRPRAQPGIAQPGADQSPSRCPAHWQHPRRPRPGACSVTGTRDARTPRADAPPPHTLREGAARLTSLLLAEDDAALGVGER